MPILRDLLEPLQSAFSANEKGQERAVWLLYTLLAIVVPLTCARTSNLLRSLNSLFGLSISSRRYYTFMASPKLPWDSLWVMLWKRIHNPLTSGRLILVLDDSINVKTGLSVWACQYLFDHAAKRNQSRYPWSQNIVMVGLLKPIHGRWCCLPMSFAFYFMKKTLANRTLKIGRKVVPFKTKFTQAVEMITRIAGVFESAPVLVVTDSWFGNAGLLKPLRETIGKRGHLLSRLRVNSVLYDLPQEDPTRTRRGRPRKYGARLGTVTEWAQRIQSLTTPYQIPLYGRVREVLAYDQVVMLKSLRCRVRVSGFFTRANR